MDRVLRNTAATLDVTFYVDGQPTAADGPVTVTITREDGTVLVAGAPADVVAGSVGQYSYTLTPQPDLDRLTVTWTGSFAGASQSLTTRVAIVGSFYVSLPEIRSRANLSDETKFTNQELADARAWFEDLAEAHCHIAFVPRYARDVITGDGADDAVLSHAPVRRIQSSTVDGTAENLTGWYVDVPVGIVTRGTGRFARARRYHVKYEHGLDQPPADVRDAALTAIRSKLLADQSGIASRELSITNEFGGTTRLAVPGADRPTGIPEIDAVLNRHRRRTPVVA